jgi:uncharacterized membrane protein
MHKLFLYILLFSSLFGVLPVLAAQESPQPVVHVVLFYSPSCGHCQYVITETVIPLIEQYGEQLVVVGIDISSAAGHDLFANALLHFNLDSGGVPFLVYGDTYLVGSIDIPEKFPGLVEDYLAQGGLDWPAIPGLDQVLAQAQTAKAQSTPAVSTEAAISPQLTTEPATPTPVYPSPTPQVVGTGFSHNLDKTVWERLAMDPKGNGLSVVVLLGMVFTMIYGASNFLSSTKTRHPKSFTWLVPVLCFVGLAVAGYLAYVETSQVEAVCGPVGDCNTVQQSEFARLFGFLPIGIIGVAGYITILFAWVISLKAKTRLASYAGVAMLAMTTFGVLFSIYLTFLEPFIIGATCAWCLTSAVIMTVLFWLSLIPGKAAILYIRYGEKHGIKRSSSSSTF